MSELKLSFGLIADIQYVDAEDGKSFVDQTVRRYRNSLVILKKAADLLHKQNLRFCVQLGDLIDQSAKRLGNQEKDCLKRCLDTVTMAKDASSSPPDWHFLIGNHDLTLFERETLLEHYIPCHHQSACSPHKLYYDFAIDGFCFIYLDGYDRSVIRPAREEDRDSAVSMLLGKNKNLSPYVDGQWASGNWFVDLDEEKLRYCPFNGGIGAEQLTWLRSRLALAKAQNERCFIFCHMPCHVDSCRPMGLLWNSEEVIAVLHEFKEHGTVVAYISGHDHQGGYTCDEAGIHFIVPPAPLECGEAEVSFGHISLYIDYFEVHWVGKGPPFPTKRVRRRRRRSNKRKQPSFAYEVPATVTVLKYPPLFKPIKS